MLRKFCKFSNILNKKKLNILAENESIESNEPFNYKFRNIWADNGDILRYLL